MSGGSFGDDVGAIVIDVGAYSTKAGFAGQDRPQTDIYTNIGYREQEKFNSASVKFPNYLCGTNFVTTALENMEIVNPIENAKVNDWNAFECLINHIFENELKILPDEHPVIMTELALSQSGHRETLSELMFEKFCVTGFYVTNPAVLAAFAHGKSSALIIDSGHTLTTVTPVIDGYALRKNTSHVSLGGAFLTEKSIELLNRRQIDIIPRYMVSSKESTQEGLPAIYTKKILPKVTESWHKFMVELEVQKFYHSVFHVSDVPLTENFHLTPAYHEFSNGFYSRFEDDRFIIPEQLFNPSCNSDSSNPPIGLDKLVTNCAFSCDAEIRSQILGNIIAIGGTSHLPGYMERLQNCLSTVISPNLKHKFCNTSYPGDRRFSVWTGGSILTSLNSFHQLWVSKAEYLESGKRSLDIKCQ